MLKSIFIASTNLGKINEFKFILNDLAKDITLSYLVKDTITEPDEPYNTFLDNAIHKAKYYAKYTMMPTLCDDSGLCIEALNGFPGVKTKDFAYECGSMTKAFDYLEKALENKDKTAYFAAAVALYLPKEDKIFSYEGKSFGTLKFPASGNYGFGFHPIFVPDGYNQTMSELGPKIIEDHISQRVKSTKNLVQILKDNKLI